MPTTAMIIAIVIGVGAGLAVFCGLYFVLRAATKRANLEAIRNDPKISDIRMDEIWQTWRRGGLSVAAAFTDDGPNRVPDERVLAVIRDELLKTEKKIHAETEPLIALRREIMNSIDRRVLQQEALTLPRDEGGPEADLIGDEMELRRSLAADALRIRLLRYYGAARFGDRAENDWYDIYEQAAQLKQHSFRNFIRRDASSGSGYRGAVVVNERLKKRLLETPPGISFSQDERRSVRN